VNEAAFQQNFAVIKTFLEDVSSSAEQVTIDLVTPINNYPHTEDASNSYPSYPLCTAMDSSPRYCNSNS
jgi:hypothetical protein